MLPIILSVPIGLPQRMHLKIAAALSTRGARASGARSRRGDSEIACSGQVSRHSPHWTHLLSTNRSSSTSCPSCSAPTGQEPTQARHIVHASASTAMVPNGAPAGSAISLRGTGACAARCSIASAAVVRFSGVPAKVAATRTASAGGPPRSAAAKAIGIGAVHQAEVLALVAQPLGDGVGDPHLVRERRVVLRRLGAGGQHRDLARAPGERRKPQVEPDRGDVMDLERDHARRQAAAAPGRRPR